jgi:hypothetical protein
LPQPYILKPGLRGIYEKALALGCNAKVDKFKSRGIYHFNLCSLRNILFSQSVYYCCTWQLRLRSCRCFLSPLMLYFANTHSRGIIILYYDIIVSWISVSKLPTFSLLHINYVMRHTVGLYCSMSSLFTLVSPITLNPAFLKQQPGLILLTLFGLTVVIIPSAGGFPQYSIVISMASLISSLLRYSDSFLKIVHSHACNPSSRIPCHVTHTASPKAVRKTIFFPGLQNCLSPTVCLE